MEQKYKLTNKPRSKYAPVCPCGRSNKDGKFRPFEVDGEPSPAYGYCHSCCELFYPPNNPNDSLKDRLGPLKPLPKARSKSPLKYVDQALVQATLKAYGSNAFVCWLWEVFGKKRTLDIMKKYKIGTAKGGAVVFWHISHSGQYMTAKKMYYDQSNGRRKGFPQVLFKQSEGYGNCLFGEHLLALYPKLKVGIVESEKTALVMSVLKEDMVWLACGGSNGLTDSKSKALKGREVFLFCDCDEAGRKGFQKAEDSGKGKLIDLYPEREDGADLCDLVLQAYTENGFFCPDGYPAIWD